MIDGARLEVAATSWHVDALKVFTGFIPWRVFSLVATAALLAFAVAAGFLVTAIVHGNSPKLLEVTGAVVFAVFGIAAR